MRDNIRVVVLGAGCMGKAIAKLLVQRPGVLLSGIYTRSVARDGLVEDGVLLNDNQSDIEICRNLPALLARTKPHIAIQANCSTVVRAARDIEVLLQYGVNVVSIAEEMAYPACRAPRLAEKIDDLAKARKVTVIGSGINPGFVMDTLVIMLTGVCQRVDAIKVRRSNDLAPYGPSVLHAQGVGLHPDAFYEGLDNGTVTGHMGFAESICLIAAALGWRIERTEQLIEPIIAKVRRVTPFVDVMPGRVAGCLHTAIAYRDEQALITLVHPQQVAPQAENLSTGDSIEIAGVPDLRFSGSPEIPGGIGTAALAVNVIPQVINAAPGLQSMTQLPISAAFMGDMRSLIEDYGRCYG